MPEFRYDPNNSIEVPGPLTCPGADICFHDMDIHRAVEMKDIADFVIEVTYQENWQEERYAPMTLIFHQASKVSAPWSDYCAGCPTIIDVLEVVKSESRFELKLEHTHGDWFIECSSVEFRAGWISENTSAINFDLEYDCNE